MLKKIFTKYKKYLFTLLVLILSIISIVMQEKDRKESMVINTENIVSQDNKIAVYITGAVKNPGVYYLDIGSRLNNLLDICGGVLETADINQVNLAKKLVDSDKIDIPYKKEESEEEETDTSDGKVNINTADKTELMTLNGIGESTAEKIIEYRETQQFVTIEDIMDVPGIGESKFSNIKDDICV